MSGSIERIKEKTGLTKPTDFPSLLASYKGQLAAALPKHMNADRMVRIALTAFRQNPGLAQCEPTSVFASCIVASQLGLEIGVLGHAYLVPYTKSFKDDKGGWQKRKECQLIPGWRGMVDLVSRAGKASVWTGAVYEGDTFDYQMGDRPFITHREMGEFEDNKLTHVYAVGRIKGSEWPTIVIWPVAKVKKHRDRYNKVGNQHYSFENFEQYARKVVLLQVLKYVPLSVEMASAYELDQAAETGNVQSITIQDAIKGDYIGLPAPAEPAELATEQPVDEIWPEGRE